MKTEKVSPLLREAETLTVLIMLFFSNPFFSRASPAPDEKCSSVSQCTNGDAPETAIAESHKLPFVSVPGVLCLLRELVKLSG